MGHLINSVGVVVPVRGNDLTIGTLATRLVTHLDDRGGPYAIVFVDDASEDDSWQQIVMASEHPRVGGLRLERRVGQMAAIVEGIRHSTSNHVVCIDADLECPPEEIARIVAHLDAGADLVSATRIGKSQRPVHRRLGYFGVRATVTRPVRRSLVDITSGFKAWRRPVSEPLLVDWDGTYLSFIERMVANASRVENVEVLWHPSEGPSGYRLSVVVPILVDAARIRAARSNRTRMMAAGALALGALGERTSTTEKGARRIAEVAAWATGGAAAALVAGRFADRQIRSAKSRAIAHVPRVVERVGVLDAS